MLPSMAAAMVASPAALAQLRVLWSLAVLAHRPCLTERLDAVSVQACCLLVLTQAKALHTARCLPILALSAPVLGRPRMS